MIKRIRFGSQKMLAELNIPGLSPADILRLAKDTGFQKRKARKVSPLAFLSLILGESVSGSPSYNDLAARIEVLAGISVSRQAIWKRVTESCVSFMQRILAQVMNAKLSHDLVPISPLAFGRYKRVLVQDSTVIQLPVRFSPAFSGVSNAHSSVCNARIQAVYDLVAAGFIEFSIDPYSKNDLKAAPELQLQKGDLVLRDRGYLIADEIQRHLDAGADCIYRHKHKTNYLDPKTQDPIDLRTILDRDDSIDMQVLLNNKARTPVRLVAAPIPEDLANLRRMKLKKETKGHAPSAELLYLASWTILITTIAPPLATFDELLRIYGLRWRIESIFKTWKSNMSFAHIHNVSENQLRVLLTARLIMIVIFSHFIYRPTCVRIKNDHGKELSLMKITKYLAKNPERIPAIITALREANGQEPVIIALARYCTYDKRKRPNFQQIQERLFTT